MASPDFVEKLKALKEQGLSFGDCVKAFGVFDHPATSEAVHLYAVPSDKDIEVDTVTVVDDTPDKGCWVMGWLWVETDDDEEEKED